MKNTTTKCGIAIADGSYRKQGTGTLVFRYKVTGSEAELQAFKDAQGEFYREDEDKTPLWFSSRNCGKRTELCVSSKGKIFADMSELDAAANLAAQYGGNFGQELARLAASQLFGKSQPSATQQVEENNADLNQA